MIQDFKDEYGQTISSFFVISLIFHLCAVIFSEGFHRPDEHLGIMRFVGYKLGLLKASEALTSWEYPAQIRPWLQPYLYYLIAIIPVKLGFTNPFFLTFLMRLFSSLLGYFSHLYFFKTTAKNFNSKRSLHIYAFALSLLWFLPFFHARTSAENLSTSFFLIGLSLFIAKITSLELKTKFSGTTKDIIIISSFWALSFICRYQMIVMSGPVLIWIFLKVENNKKLLLYGIGTFILIQFLSFPLDYLGYGEWTLAPWNYFKENIISGKSSQFGTDPFWYYISKVFSRGIPFISIFLIIPAFWMFLKKPLHLISFIGLIFLVVHSFIGHKEIRFIFPLAPLASFYIAYMLQTVKFNLLPNWLVKFIIFQSTLALLISTFKPAHNPIDFYKFLYSSPSKINKIYTLNVIRDQLYFYQNRKIEFKHVESQQSIQDQKFYLLSDRLFKHSCEVVYRSYPEWIIGILKKYSKKSKVWTLVLCITN